MFNGREFEEVFVSVTADDGLMGGRGESVLSPPFPLDNNLPPQVVLGGSSFVRNLDERRGIPVPFSLSDGDNARDELIVVFQWSTDPTGFPALPASREEIERDLLDPARRRELAIATEQPAAFAGSIAVDVNGIVNGIVNGNRIRLPELASSAAHLRAGGLEKRELEILRSSGVPAPLGHAWDLDAPVAAVPLGDGRRALVLDHGSSTSWRLRELELVSGQEVRRVAPAAGASARRGRPTTLALEPPPAVGSDPVSALVALELQFAWWVERVDLESGEVTTLVLPGGALAFGSVRAIEPLGAVAAVATVGDSLVRLNYPAHGEAGTGNANVLLDGLAEPWGLARSRLAPETIYVAERTGGSDGEGRIFALNLDTHERGVLGSEELGFPRPEALALERHGTRLLAVTDAAADGQRELHAINLGRGREPFKIVDFLDGAVGTIATGPDGLRLLALTERGDLAVGGGLEQRRRIVGGVAGTADEVRLDAPLEPPQNLPARWRIRDGVDTRTQVPAPPGSSDPQGGLGPTTPSEPGDELFVWDSRDAFGAAQVALRVTAYDGNRGNASSSSVLRPVRTSLATEAVALAGRGDEGFAAAGDLDGDGDLDLASVESNGGAALYLQDSQQDFGLPSGEDACARLADGALGRPEQLGLSRTARIADLDGDQKGDLVTALLTQSRAAIFWSAGELDADDTPLRVGTDADTCTAQTTAVGDLDSDGRLDLVIGAGACADSNVAAAVFLQHSDRVFGVSDRPDERLGTLTGPGATGTLAAEIADLDGDGDLDVVTSGPDSIFLYLQDDEEHFGRPGASDLRLPDRTLGGPDWTRAPTAIRLADLSADGFADITVAARLDSSIAVFLQDVDGEFGLPGGNRRTPNTILGGPETTSFPRTLAIPDLDGDGIEDVITANSTTGDIFAFLGRGAGTFGAVVSEPAPSPPTAGVRVPPDAQFANPGNVLVLRTILAGDFDHDGGIDLVTRGAQDVLVRGRVQPGTFGGPCLEAEQTPDLLLGSFEDGASPQTVAAGDLDGDGSIDLVSANLENNIAGRGRLSVFLQTSPGEFGLPSDGRRRPSFFVGGAGRTDKPRDVLAHDLDADGDLDLVSANSGGEHVAVFLQERRGSFGRLEGEAAGEPQQVLRVEEAPEPRALAATDLNADGRMDLIVAAVAPERPTADRLAVFLQDAAGRFGNNGRPQQVLGQAELVEPRGLLALDLDGDGDSDLACTSAGTDLVFLFLQGGSGTFELFPLGSDATTRRPSGLAAGDVDGDGDLDLVVGNEGDLVTRAGSHVTLFLQEEPGVFQLDGHDPIGSPTLTDGPTFVALGDLDQDGQLELIAANSFGSTLTLFRQFAPGRFEALPYRVLSDVRAAKRTFAADLDGDGDPDLATAASGLNAVSVYFAAH